MHRHISPVAAASVVILLTAAASAQLKVVTLPRPGASDASARADDLSPEPYLLRPGHYVLPAPYRADYWSPHLRPFPDYSTLRQPPTAYRNPSFGANNQYPRGYGPCGPILGFGYQSNGDVQSAYNQGRYDADHEYQWFIASQRAGQLLNQSSAQFNEGLSLFREGQYEKALMNLLGAADLNHDSAAPRLHAGHALFALGRYRDAVPLLERAFELMPNLAYKTYDIRDEYGSRDDFEQQLSDLRACVRRHPTDVGELTMLGYVTYYSAGPAAAAPYLSKAAKLAPKSYFIPKLLGVSNSAVSPLREKPSTIKPSIRKKRMKNEAANGARLVQAEFRTTQ